jgi:hypothetical protein
MGGLPKISQETRVEIAKRGREGEFPSILAKEYGLSYSYVWSLIKNGVPMRLKIDSTMGCHAKRIYAPACTWPRQKMPERKIRQSSDIQKVRNYLRQNPKAKAFDVALVFHLGDKHAMRLMREAKCQKG